MLPVSSLAAHRARQKTVTVLLFRCFFGMATRAIRVMLPVSSLAAHRARQKTVTVLLFRPAFSAFSQSPDIFPGISRTSHSMPPIHAAAIVGPPAARPSVPPDGLLAMGSSVRQGSSSTTILGCRSFSRSFARCLPAAHAADPAETTFRRCNRGNPRPGNRCGCRRRSGNWPCIRDRILGPTGARSLPGNVQA